MELVDQCHGELALDLRGQGLFVGAFEGAIQMGEQVVGAHLGAAFLFALQPGAAPLYGVNQQVVAWLGQGIQCFR